MTNYFYEMPSLHLAAVDVVRSLESAQVKMKSSLGYLNQKYDQRKKSSDNPITAEEDNYFIYTIEKVNKVLEEMEYAKSSVSKFI